MIITKLINNLKCLIELYRYLVGITDVTELNLLDPLKREEIEITAESESSLHSAEIPLDAQIISIIVFRDDESQHTLVEDFHIVNYSDIVVDGDRIITVTTAGTKTVDYKITITYKV